MSGSENLNWDIDTSIGLIINEVAKKHNVDSSVVRKVVTIYYKNISYAMESGKLPKVNIKGLGTFRPVPKFIKLRIDSMLRKNNPDVEIIKTLEDAFNKESLTRDKNKRNKKYRKYE